MGDTLLRARALGVDFGPRARPVQAVTNIDLDVASGEIIGVAGESGSGKSTLSAALVRALARTARVSGQVLFRGRDLLSAKPRELRDLRRREFAMVLQNPMTAFDPLFTIGSQVREVLRAQGTSAREVNAVGLARLREVRLTAPELRARQYPHQMSGGMKQRILIAMATASSPSLLVADEPTSALDATIQEEILILFREIRDRHGTAILLVSHDLAAIRRVSDRTIVMYASRVVEDGPTVDVFSFPRHPYTRGLLDALPRIEGDEVRLTPIPGQVPDLSRLGIGCAFAPRCMHALMACREAVPALRLVGSKHVAACINPVPA